jgi:hypothetical protein
VRSTSVSEIARDLVEENALRALERADRAYVIENQSDPARSG